MPTLKILHMNYDGDDAGVRAMLKEIERTFLSDDAIKPIAPLAPIETQSPASASPSKAERTAPASRVPTLQQKTTCPPSPSTTGRRSHSDDDSTLDG